MDIRYRLINENDVDAACELEKASFADPWPRSAFEEIVHKPDADYYVAEDVEYDPADGSEGGNGDEPGTGRLVGGCVVFRILDEGDITNVAVDADYRDLGIATGLVKYAIKQNETLGIKDFTLEVRASNEAAIRVYEKCGFESVGIRPGFYDHPKEDAVVMWRYHNA